MVSLADEVDSGHIVRGRGQLLDTVSSMTHLPPLTKDSGGLKIRQESVAPKGGVNCYLSTETPVIFLPSLPTLPQGFPHNETTIGGQITGYVVIDSDCHICQVVNNPRDQ